MQMPYNSQVQDQDPSVGTLAQVMFITVADESREEMIDIATDKLRNYMRLLYEVSKMGASVTN